MKTRKVLKRFISAHVLIILSICFLGFAQELQGAEFTRSLEMGDYGQDVYLLQRLLNQKPQTQVSASGAGSPGRETWYFGSLTRAAVVKFQEFYASDILHPLGLFQGTGYVGPSTIKKLNQLAPSDNKVSVINLNQDQSNSADSTYDTTLGPEIFSISPTRGGAGTEVTIRGQGFDLQDNTVYASYDALEGVPSADGKTIKIKVYEPFPDGLQLPSGFRNDVPILPYGIMVKTKYGKSDALPFTFEL